MALCLKRLKNLSKVRLVDAKFVWTEPHSKRIKVQLSVQAEVVQGTILQQSFVVEYVVGGQMCDTCRRVEAKDTWNANVRSLIFFDFFFCTKFLTTGQFIAI
jgi:nonsense-mediated mRNA decay protein 3